MRKCFAARHGLPHVVCDEGTDAAAWPRSRFIESILSLASDLLSAEVLRAALDGDKQVDIDDAAQVFYLDNSCIMERALRGA